MVGTSVLVTTPIASMSSTITIALYQAFIVLSFVFSHLYTYPHHLSIKKDYNERLKGVDRFATFQYPQPFLYGTI